MNIEVGQQMCLAINYCSASRQWLWQAEEDILYLYWEGLKFENDLLFQGIVNTSKELLVDLIVRKWRMLFRVINCWSLKVK